MFGSSGFGGPRGHDDSGAAGRPRPIGKASSEILRLSPEICEFSSKNGFPSLTLKKGEETVHYNKVSFHRTFPFELLWQYISVLDDEDGEIGLIYDINDFGEASDIIRTELERRYYEPRILSVVSLKERYGFSYWKVKLTDRRTVEFTMQDTFRNIIRAGEDKAILLDVDANRFVIESIKALDRKSYKRIELYL